MSRLSSTTLAAGLLAMSLSACSVVPEPVTPDMPLTVPLPPQRPRLTHVRLSRSEQHESAADGHRFLLRPRVLRPRPDLGLRSTLRAPVPAETASLPRPAVPARPTPSAVTPSVQEGWGASIPGSIPIQPRGWTPLLTDALREDTAPVP